MKQESLDKAFETILTGLDKRTDIEPNDKLELLMNLKTFLTSVEQYEKDVKTLQLTNQNNKWRK